MTVAPWRTRLETAARSSLPGDRMQRVALLALLLLASVLRFWDLPHIPYTHDEISALVRIHPSLGETIRTGVVALDTHPPGVQVFEWAWTRLFGMGEAAVKLPFILLSIAALFFLYRFASAWAGSQEALVVTALLATLQYTVMYGQIARPYAFGFFTTALMADQLTRYLGSGRRTALAGFAAAAVLSAYTHHFALMLAAFMAITGLLLVASNHRKPYLAACAMAAVLYLPNIPIFLRQLGQKGLEGWLAAPTPSWIPDYLWWLAHCTWTLGAIWAVLILGSLALKIRHRDTIAPLWAITLLWGLGPLVVGYAYSVWRAPVLQYSMLIFSFPYLVLGLLAGLRHLPSRWLLPVLALVACASTFTLVQVRKHYDTFYRSRYVAITDGIMQASTVPGRLALVDTPDEAIQFLLRQRHAGPPTAPYINLRGHSAAWVDSLLASLDASEVFLGLTPGTVPERAAQVQAAFPFMAERHDMVEGQTFVFRADPAAGSVEDSGWNSRVTPEAIKGEGWTVDADLPLWHDTTSAYGIPAWDLTGREYGILLDVPVYKVTQEDNAVIEARLDIIHATGTGLNLVTELKAGEESTFYRSQACFRESGPLVSAIPLADLPGHGHGQRLRVYVWNMGGATARISSVEVKVREGNPWLYGFVEPLKGPLVFR